MFLVNLILLNSNGTKWIRTTIFDMQNQRVAINTIIPLEFFLNIIIFEKMFK